MYIHLCICGCVDVLQLIISTEVLSVLSLLHVGVHCTEEAQ